MSEACVYGALLRYCSVVDDCAGEGLDVLDELAVVVVGVGGCAACLLHAEAVAGESPVVEVLGKAIDNVEAFECIGLIAAAIALAAAVLAYNVENDGNSGSLYGLCGGCPLYSGELDEDCRKGKGCLVVEELDLTVP